jgi:hypothetical protein
VLLQGRLGHRCRTAASAGTSGFPVIGRGRSGNGRGRQTQRNVAVRRVLPRPAPLLLPRRRRRRVNAEPGRSVVRTGVVVEGIQRLRRVEGESIGTGGMGDHRRPTAAGVVADHHRGIVGTVVGGGGVGHGV